MNEPSSPVPAADRHAAWWPVLGLVLGGLALWAWWPEEPVPVRQAALHTADAPSAPWPAPAAASSAGPVATPVAPRLVGVQVQFPPAPVPPGHALPTLDADERAALREALAQVGAMDGASRQEFEALLFQDGLQRLQALRQAGDRGIEHDALVLELRAALPVHAAAKALPPALLQSARSELGLPLAPP